MGRRMRPLDPAEGVVERFACELRALRAAAGDLPFWKMASRCGISKSALAAAVAGYQLPSERVTRQFVQVCGGDWSWWSQRLAYARDEAARLSTAAGVDESTAPAGGAVILARSGVVHVVGTCQPVTVDEIGWPRFGATASVWRRTWPNTGWDIGSDWWRVAP
jgi:hypothetical protein